MVNTDEGPKQSWTSKEMDYTLMKCTLTEAAMVADWLESVKHKLVHFHAKDISIQR